MKQNPRPLAALAAVAALALPGMPLAQAQVTPQTLQSISMPNKVVTPIGQLEFFDGVPTDATYDFVPGNKIIVMCPPPLCGWHRPWA